MARKVSGDLEVPRKQSGQLEIPKKSAQLEKLRKQAQYLSVMTGKNRRDTNESVTVVNFESDDGDSYHRQKNKEDGKYTNAVFFMLVYLGIA